MTFTPLILALAMTFQSLAPLTAQDFSQMGRDALAAKSAPGISMAVVHDGRIVYEGGFGLADVAASVPVNAQTRFAIGSLTKQWTAAAILLLVQQHRLHLNDTLAKFVPSLPNARTMTLRMLLNQTSGLHNYPILSEHPWPESGSVSTSQILHFLAMDNPDFAPGTQWEYSNANYAALTAVVEKVSGEPMGTFLKTHIFTPLHMRASGFGLPAQTSAPIATSYQDGKPLTPPITLDVFSGAGAGVSSAHDMARWDMALMKGTLLSRASTETMFRAGTLSNGKRVKYAMGWVPASIAGHREFWHNGLAPGAGGYCLNAIFPNDGLAVIVLTNGFGAAGTPERLVAQVAAAYGIGAAPPAAQAVPTQAPGDDPHIDASARAFWNALSSGNVDRSVLTPQFSAALTPALLTSVQQGLLMMGDLRAFVFAGTQSGNGFTVYRYALVFANGTQHEWDVAITPAGKIAGSHLAH